MTPMRGLHVITDLSIGGAQQALTRFIASDAWRRDEWHVVSLVDEGELGAALRASGATVTSLGMHAGRPSWGALRHLVRVMRAWSPDIVVTWLYHADLLGTVAWRHLRDPRPPLAWNLRASDMDMRHYRWLSWITRATCARLSTTPDAVITNSDAGRRAHEALGYTPKRWIDCPNGIDIDYLRPDAALRVSSRDALGVASGDVLVGLVARVDPMKDHATFVAAARRLASLCPRVKFLAVGTGVPASPLLIAATQDPALRDRIILRDAQSDLRPVYAALDIATLTSSFGEGFPNVVAEAMACGVPVVTTDVGDAARIVGDAGVVVRAGDDVGLSTAWGQLAELPTATRAALGASARARIVERYGIEDLASHFRGHLAELISARVPTGSNSGA